MPAGLTARLPGRNRGHTKRLQICVCCCCCCCCQLELVWQKGDSVCRPISRAPICARRSLMSRLFALAAKQSDFFAFRRFPIKRRRLRAISGDGAIRAGRQLIDTAAPFRWPPDKRPAIVCPAPIWSRRATKLPTDRLARAEQPFSSHSASRFWLLRRAKIGPKIKNSADDAGQH